MRQGRCVRLYQGDYQQETVFSENPVEVALEWQSLGAPRLHIVDLDGAATGEPVNVDIIREIAEALLVPVQVGGGIRRLESIEQLLKIGVDRVILGTAAVGEDLGMQISGNLYSLYVDPGIARAYYEAALESYVAGLRDAGWQGSPETVRFACATAASLRLVPFGTLMLREMIDAAGGESWADHLAREQGSTVEETLQRWGQAIVFLLELADEARALV